MKILLSLAPVTLLFFTSCGPECGYGTQMVGRNVAITGPSGNITGVGTINVGSIQDQRTYALTTQRVTDLVQQMQICCSNKQRARAHKDAADVAWWTEAEHKCFNEMLELQRQLPASNAPATVAPPLPPLPVVKSSTDSSAPEKNPKPAATPEPGTTKTPAKAVTGPKASVPKVKSWLSRSGIALRQIKKNADAHTSSSQEVAARTTTTTGPR